MKIRIILSNSRCEIDRLTFDASDEFEEASEQIIDALHSWTLSPGDTIKIVEVS